MSDTKENPSTIAGEPRLRELLEKIEILRAQWSLQAYGIERTHGDDDSAAKAFKCCSGDLFKMVHNE